MTAVPDWMYPPNGRYWTADDLDRLPPEAPRHTEIIDGALILTMLPRRKFHGLVMRRLAGALERQLPDGLAVEQEMTVRLGHRTRPEPDLIVYQDDGDLDRTFYEADEVLLVVEIVSEESEERDRDDKPRRYARAGIPHFWRVEEENGLPVVHVFELEPTTGAYTSTGIRRNRLTLTVPFPIDIDLKALVA